MNLVCWSGRIRGREKPPGRPIVVYRNGEKLYTTVDQILVGDLGAIAECDEHGCKELLPITRIEVVNER